MAPQKGFIPWNKGLKKEDNPLYKRPRSDITKKRIGLAHKGKVMSKESRLKIGKFNKGKKLSEEHKKKMSIATIKRYDRIGRKVYKRYIHVRDKIYINWRTKVFERDNWTCQTCGIRGCYLEAHHTHSWSEYPKLRYELENGVTLCLACHKLTNNYKNKKYAK